MSKAIEIERGPAIRVGVLPSILTRYTLREILVPAVLGLVVVGFLGIANEIRERSQLLPIQYVTAWDVARMIFYFSPTLIAYIIPITYMLGILLAFGRLAQNNEITAMKAAGVPLKRLVAPVIVVGALLSGLAFYLQDRMQPLAMTKVNNLIFSELPQRITIDILPTGSMQEIAGLRLYIGDRDVESRTLKNIVVLQPKANGDWVYYAESAQFINTATGSRLDLRNGHVLWPAKEDVLSRGSFKELSFPVEAAQAMIPTSLRKTRPISELLVDEKRDAEIHAESKSRSSAENLRKTRTEISDRISLPLACLAVSLLAAPLAIRSPRAGRSYSFAIGAAIVFCYYMLRIFLGPSDVVSLGESIARGMAPNVLLGGLGAAAIWRVDRI